MILEVNKGGVKYEKETKTTVKKKIGSTYVIIRKKH